MKKAALMLSMALLAGCAPKAEVPVPNPSPSATPVETTAPTPVETPAPVPVPGERCALVLDGKDYVILGDFQTTEAFQEAEMTELPEEFPWPVSRQYEGEGISATTFLEEDGEKLVDITTWGPGETPEGIGVGSTLEELKAAYPADLFYINGACGNGTEPVAYTRRYECNWYRDGDSYAYIFYLNEKKVVTIVACGGPFGPQAQYEPEVVLGDPRIRWEVLSDKPGSTLVRYFIEDESGVEETVLEAHGGTEAHDLDGDGVVELVFWEDGPLKAVGIYDSVDGALVYTDVNQTLGCRWSSFMGWGTGLGHPYAMCIEVGNETGKSGDVYSYADGKLTYECSYEEAMGWT